MAELPTGTVTFLFTDIEGSTRHWEQNAQAMQAALARHDVLLRSLIEDNGGHVFKTMGDAFCAAFPAASQALQAALSSVIIALNLVVALRRPLGIFSVTRAEQHR
jgi:class 3 adenylate cyclase